MVKGNGGWTVNKEWVHGERMVSERKTEFGECLYSEWRAPATIKAQLQAQCEQSICWTQDIKFIRRDWAFLFIVNI